MGFYLTIYAAGTRPQKACVVCAGASGNLDKTRNQPGKLRALNISKQSFSLSTDSATKNKQLLEETEQLQRETQQFLEEDLGYIENFLQSQDVVEVPLPTQLSDTTQAIILAGGSSSNPLVQQRAIAATPLGSNLKVIDSTIHNCIQSGIDKIYVLTQFNSQPLNSYITNTYKPTLFGRSHSWVEVLASTQTPKDKAWARGSADAVRRSFPTLLHRWHGSELPDEFLIISSEAVCSIDYMKLIAAHRLMGADITMATTSVEAEKAPSLGLCIIDPISGKVLDFVEKPEGKKLQSMKQADFHTTEQRPFEASMGIYVFNRQVLVDLLEGRETKSDSRNTGTDFIHFGSDVIPHALNEYRVCAYHHGGYWKNLATLQSYFQVNMELLHEDSPISMADTTSAIRDCSRFLPPSTVHNCTLDRCLLGEGCILMGSTIINSIIGDNTIVGTGTRIEDSMIWGADYYQSLHMVKEALQKKLPVFGVGNNCTIKNAILDYNVRVGDNCTIVNKQGIQEANREDEGYVISDGIIVLLKGAVFPDGFEF
eukprot:TRINITY_DN70751_c0_g1_i1.p1 TRINITY_DN70751_c0_g1~~TRINITY_DN70751_c0_g1_i1.p1  ORF type:complete len:540 (+),score=40.62 TRINITY_DN70751_c0_g1_i1:117-1736(+)